MTEPDGLVEVRLLGLPVPLRERSTQHGEELVREMTLMVAQQRDAGSPTIPQRLVGLAADVRSTYGMFTQHANTQMDAAAEAGIAVIEEIVYHVPAHVAATCEHILAVISEVDEYCREGRYLLALATPPDVWDYQQWILGEFIGQVRGGQPTSWLDFSRQLQSD